MPCPLPGEDPSYIIAAALLDTGDCAETRWALEPLGGKRKRFPWKDAESTERVKAVTTVQSLPALHLLVIGVPLNARNQERARRKVLSRMLFELHQREVDLALLESRKEAARTVV